MNFRASIGIVPLFRKQNQSAQFLRIWMLKLHEVILPILKNVGKFLPLSSLAKSNLRRMFERSFRGEETFFNNTFQTELHDPLIQNFLKEYQENLVLIDGQALVGSDYYRGIGRFSKSLGLALAERFPDIGFAIFTTNLTHKKNLQTLFKEIEKSHLKNIKVLVIDVYENKKIISMAHAESCLSESLDKIKPRFVIIPSFFHPNVEVLKFSISKNTRLIGILHDLIPLQFLDNYLPSRSDYENYLNNLSRLISCDFLASVSKTSLYEYEKRFGHHPNEIVIGGASVFDVAENSLEASVDREGMVCIGGSEVSKNLERFVRAFCKLNISKSDSFHLTIVGVVSFKQRLTLRAIAFIKHARVSVLGFVSDEVLGTLYKRSKLLIIPSLAEGLSLPVYEMWAHGGIAIGGRNTAVEETINFSPATFDVVNFLDLEETLSAIMLDHSTWEKIRIASVEQLKTKTWGDVASKFDNILLESGRVWSKGEVTLE